MRVVCAAGMLLMALVALAISACGSSGPATQSPAIPVPSPSIVGPAVYQNPKIGLQIYLPPGITANDDMSSGPLKFILHSIPATGRGGVYSRIGGLVAFYPACWDGITEPGGFAAMWRQPPLYGRKVMVRLEVPSVFRKVVAALTPDFHKLYGPNVTVVATHVAQFPAIKLTFRITRSGVPMTYRWSWVYTPKSEYAFFGWTRTSRAKDWMWMFDRMNASTSISV